MDEKQAAANVLLGAAIGASVPVIIALVMAGSVPEFRPSDYFFSITLLSVFSGAVGVAVNLPRQPEPSTRSTPHGQTSSRHQRSRSRHTRQSNRSNRNEQASSSHQSQTQDESSHRKTHRTHRSSSTSPGRSSMTYIQALRELELVETTSQSSLGAAETFTEKQIRSAYRKLAMTYHPDRVLKSNSSGDQQVIDDAIEAASEKFKRINEAYNRLRQDS